MRGYLSPKSLATLTLGSARSEALAELSAEFESLIESMQTPEVRKGVDAAFNATPEELGRAAVKAARRRSCSSGTMNNEHEILTLTHRDWEAFLAGLDNTDRPRPRLEEAARRYLSQRESDAESARPSRDPSSHPTSE